MSLEFRTDSRFENILSNGKSRMTLVSLDAGEAVDTHRVPIPVSVVVVSGEINFRASGEDFRLKPGEALVMEPGEEHSLAGIVRSSILVTRFDNPKE
jgi:quercetin dioxygenase-like cupin family protein